MTLNDTSRLCSKYIDRYGQAFEIEYTSGEKISGNAIFQSVWSKTKSKFLGTNSQIGEINDDYLIYTGPAEIDITALGRRDTLILNGKEYYFVKSQMHYLANRKQYCSGVLRRIYRGDENAY